LDHTVYSQEHKIELIQISLKLQILEKWKNETHKELGIWELKEEEKQIGKDI
jgi:hypothetical protein